jgi:hypothetical protein
VTALLGPQYRRSRDLIEIDITYDCNLRCMNCNRSCRQAPSETGMTLAQIERFCHESMKKGKRWKRIRILGGEPTLHPDIDRILECLHDAFGAQGTKIEIVTNGFGKANQVLRRLPEWVAVDNSNKRGPVQEHFGPFNVAPTDRLRYRFTSFGNGCQVPETCGVGLTPFGYYGCAIAGGIDRIAGFGVGRQELPDDDDDMLDHFERFCRLCGRFGDGHFVPHNLRPRLMGERMSPTWKRLYAKWRTKHPRLPLYGERGEG